MSNFLLVGSDARTPFLKEYLIDCDNNVIDATSINYSEAAERCENIVLPVQSFVGDKKIILADGGAINFDAFIAGLHPGNRVFFGVMDKPKAEKKPQKSASHLRIVD